MPKGQGYGSLPTGSSSARNKLIASYKKKTPKKKPGGMSKETARTTKFEDTAAPFQSVRTGQTKVKRSMLTQDMIDSGNFIEDRTLTDYDRAMLKTYQKYGIRPTTGKFASNSSETFKESEGVGSSRARQKLINMLYPRGRG